MLKLAQALLRLGVFLSLSFSFASSALEHFPVFPGHQGIITHTKRIVLPEYPTAYNPSIIEWGDQFLLTFRYTPDLYGKSWISYIGVVLLNRDFEIISSPQILDVRFKQNRTPSQAEDARIFSYRNRFFLIYNDNIDIEAPSYTDRRDMFIAELSCREGIFRLSNPLKLTHPGKYKNQLWQKNWVPFEWHRRLLVTYSITPHEILDINLLHGECCPYAETFPALDWDFGILRCSTPPILVDGEYLSFFHSAKMIASEASWEYKLWHYFMGAYTFSAEPPFTITSYTQSPIIDDSFYTKSSYFKRVVFPGGLVAIGSNIYLAYGKDDREMWIATLDKEALKRALIPAS